VTAAVPTVSLRCSGCSWRGSANTLDGLNKLAREHDDSPRARHIVTLDPARGWPESEAAFRELLANESTGCRWFALCANRATGVVPHPVLGSVPVCDRCRDRRSASA
jgi:hypothetical protein